MEHATTLAGVVSSHSSRSIPSTENLVSGHPIDDDNQCDPSRLESNMASKLSTLADAKPHDAVAKDADADADAAAAEAALQEHTLTFWQAVKLYPTAVGWSLFVSLGVIMLAFDPQIVGSMYAMPQFQKDFGYERDGEVSSYWLESTLPWFSDGHGLTDQPTD